MITLLVGHRGVGKTTFLKTLARQKDLPCFDLDEEIERQTGQRISNLFKEGERNFRLLESRTLFNLIEAAKGPLVVALGAGYEGPMPSEAKVLWLRRVNDSAGRVFLNRPRLNSEVSMLEEYMERFEAREKRFAGWAHEELFLPEGEADFSRFVDAPERFEVPFDLTLLPENFRDWFRFTERRRDWNVRFFELRDDLLSPDQMEIAAETIPPQNILFSRRAKGEHFTVPFATDWPLELGAPKERVHIVSKHERGESLRQALDELSAHKADLLKLAVEIHDFSELREGHRWWQEDPARRAFLPRSTQGKWRWYRSLFGPRMPLHFFREGGGSAKDQPYFWQTQLQPKLEKNFAAVLGHPVEHSLTPLEHLEFFKKKKMPVVAVDVREDEFAQAWPILNELGLTHAAVTAPLKKLAFSICTKVSRQAADLKSVNTLLVKKGEVHGENTDVFALRKIKESLPSFAKIWLWGGGGTIRAVKSVWPEAVEISARTGKPRQAIEIAGKPDLLIWAAGRANDFQWPAGDVNPQLVLDLNYGADSPGLQFAAERNLPYQSGLNMFKLQAENQRAFWKEND